MSASPEDPLVEAARALLAGWVAPDAAQDAMRTRYLGFLAEHPAASRREHRPGHLTASTVLLDHDRRHVLLTLHPLAGRWYQLGGHCEPGDASVEGVAAREAAEESGIAGIVMHPAPIGLDWHATTCRDGSGRPGPSQHLDVEHVGLAPPGARPAMSAESVDLGWFPLDRLPAGADDVVRTLIGRVRAAGLA